MTFIMELPYGNFDEATRRAIERVREINIARESEPPKTQLEFIRMRVSLQEVLGYDNVYLYEFKLT